MTHAPVVVHLAARPEAGLRGSLDVELAPGCTTLVGPNGIGKGAVLDELAAALSRDGAVVVVRAEDGPREVVAAARAIVAQHGAVNGLDQRCMAAVLAEARHVVPEVAEVEVDGATGSALARDHQGVELGIAAGLRASWAIGVARALAEAAVPLVAIILEEPGAFLHPAAQEALRDRLAAVGADLAIPVVLSAESPFVVPRGAIDAVVSLGRDAEGATTVVDRVAGDDPHAGLVGGLFRDPGLGAVLDRAARLVPGTRAVMVVEGGTDEAYLRLAADVLDRADELADLAIIPAGGASSAALQAVVLRAETDLPVLVVLDNDEPGRHARDTLAKRMGFERRRGVTTYAEVVPGYPMGTEAEDLFDWRFLDRFVTEMGQESITGKHLLHGDVWHYDLTSSAKSAFVAWARQHAEPEDVAGWALLIDILIGRLLVEADAEEPSSAS